MSLLTPTLQTTPTIPVVLDLLGRDTGIADAGGYYTGITPTPGTGIIGHPADRKSVV